MSAIQLAALEIVRFVAKTSLNRSTVQNGFVQAVAGVVGMGPQVGTVLSSIMCGP
jgi:hypothetical protein